MLSIYINEKEFYNEKENEFVVIKPIKLQLEHSLVSVSKWESKFKKSFLSSNNKTDEEVIEYIKCMTITQNVDPMVYLALSKDNIRDITNYIGNSMTATTFSSLDNNKKSNEIITSELIYYWMIALNIPWECQKWHLNRLLTLIRVCNIKNTPPKKMSRNELNIRNAEINAARRKKFNTKG